MVAAIRRSTRLKVTRIIFGTGHAFPANADIHDLMTMFIAPGVAPLAHEFRIGAGRIGVGSPEIFQVLFRSMNIYFMTISTNGT